MDIIFFLLVFIVLMAIYCYRGYRYDTYLQREHPDLAKELRVSVFTLYNVPGGTKVWKNIFRKLDVADPELIRLHKKLKSTVIVLVLFPFMFIFVEFIYAMVDYMVKNP